jgi:hypothetical protein
MCPAGSVQLLHVDEFEKAEAAEMGSRCVGGWACAACIFRTSAFDRHLSLDFVLSCWTSVTRPDRTCLEERATREGRRDKANIDTWSGPGT